MDIHDRNTRLTLVVDVTFFRGRGMKVFLRVSDRPQNSKLTPIPTGKMDDSIQGVSERLAQTLAEVDSNEETVRANNTRLSRQAETTSVLSDLFTSSPQSQIVDHLVQPSFLQSQPQSVGGEGAPSYDTSKCNPHHLKSEDREKDSRTEHANPTNASKKNDMSTSLVDQISHMELNTPPAPPPPPLSLLPPNLGRPYLVGRSPKTTRVPNTNENTESTLPTRPDRLNERAVSWGDNVPREIVPERSQRPHGHTRNISSIPVDLLNPFETEAEVNILRALQSRSPMISRKVLSQVPDDRSHNFEIRKSSDADEGNKKSNTTLGTLAELTDALEATEHGSNTSNQPPSSRGAIYSRGESLEIYSEGSQGKVSVSNTTSNDRGKANDSETKPLMRHRRQPTTVEMALNDLKDNLAAFHDPESQEEEQNGSQSFVVSDNDNDESHPKREPTMSGGWLRTFCRRKLSMNEKISHCWEKWRSFRQTISSSVKLYVKSVTCYLILPAMATACILFYFFDNPTSDSGASVSWWLVLVCRELVVFSMALAMQIFVIDFLALGTELILRSCGPIVTLIVVHAKGWPFVTFCWGMLSFGLLYGSSFARHWLYFQDTIKIFSEINPDGGILERLWYERVLLIATSVSVVVTLKRFLVSLFLGRQTFFHHCEQLANLLEKMLLVSQVAALAREKRVSSAKYESLRGLAYADDDSDTRCSAGNTIGTVDRVVDMNARDPITGNLTQREKMKLYQLLEQWEDPRSNSYEETDTASIAAVLNFRKALAFIQKRYPFSYAFGPAQTREECVDSAQKIYDLLIEKSEGNEVLKFETIAVIALDGEEAIDQTKAKALMKAFRPDREGNLSMLDFLRSIDAIYKEYMFLHASIENSSAIDRQVESILNWFFYGAVLLVVVSQMGFDPLALFLSLSSVILGFTFMIGNAASGYVDGIMFIVGRRPMSIGDGVCFGEPDSPLSLDGSPPYFVKSMSLLQTTAVFAPTNEVRVGFGGTQTMKSVSYNTQKGLQFCKRKFGKLPRCQPCSLP